MINHQKLIGKIKNQMEWDRKNRVASFFNEDDIKELESN